MMAKRKPAFDYGKNSQAPTLDVRHSLLVRASAESAYRSVCPACNHGLLLVRRDDRTFELLRHDRCISCGQTVRYVDDAINGERLKR